MSPLPKLSLGARPRPIAYLPALIALAAGGWFAWKGWEAWNEYVPLGAVVTESKVDTMMIVGKPLYHPEITYEFIADGFTQTSTTVRKGNPAMSASKALAWVQKYPPGTKTSAYLNSDNVEDIVLVRENGWMLPLVIAVAGLAALLFLLWEDRVVWGPKVAGLFQRSSSISNRPLVDPRGKPPSMQLSPPEGMEGARWDPSPGEDGLPRGWVQDDLT